MDRKYPLPILMVVAMGGIGYLAGKASTTGEFILSGRALEKKTLAADQSPVGISDRHTMASESSVAQPQAHENVIAVPMPSQPSPLSNIQSNSFDNAIPESVKAQQRLRVARIQAG